MSAKMPATAEMRAAKAMPAATMAAAVTSATVPAAAMAATTAPGDRCARKHGKENNNGNSDHAP